MESAASHPAAASAASATAQAVAAAIERHAHRPGALLPLLHDVQQRLGYLPEDCVAPIARALNLSRAEVHGVISFYHDFRREPPGQRIVRVCQAEACRSRGAEALMAHAEQRLGCEPHARSVDGGFSLEPVYCLGQCANAPAVMIDGSVHARVTPQRLDGLLGLARPPLTRPAPASREGSIERGGIAVYVPCDSTALAVGADDVAAEIATQAAARGIAFNLVRNGSRGAFWLEPLVEVGTASGRVGYGPVCVPDVASLFEADFLAGGAHPLRLGRVDELPWLGSQQRLTFARIGIVDPQSLADYEAHEGYVGLRRALAMTPEAVVAEVTDSGLRGRGGAAFPAGIKWQTAARAPGERKYVVCNADEGDSGSFADRLLMESDPFAVIEGMTIAGIAVGATQGYVYVRSEYPHAVAALEGAIATARAAQRLGADVLGSGKAFDVEVRVGAGAYICGEETALLESLEGRRGVVRAKPPLPAIAGLFGQPTVVNNVVTLATVPAILARGAAFHRDVGTGRSRGTLAAQLAGNVRHGGLVEVRLRHHAARTAHQVRRRNRVRPAGPRGPGGWAARCLRAGERMGPADGLRGIRAPGRDARPRQRRRARRHFGHGRAGPLRDGVLRARKLRQVHAVPDRCGARRRGDRPDHRRPRAPAADRTAARAVRHDGPRLAVRDGRHGAVSGALRPATLPRGLRRRLRGSTPWTASNCGVAATSRA